MHYTRVSSPNRHDSYTSIQSVLSFTGYRNLTLIDRVYHQTMIPEWRKVYKVEPKTLVIWPSPYTYVKLMTKPSGQAKEFKVKIVNFNRLLFSNNILCTWLKEVSTTGQGNKLETRWIIRVLFVMQPVTMISLKALKPSYAFNLGKMYGQRLIWPFYFTSEMYWILVNLMSTW